MGAFLSVVYTSQGYRERATSDWTPKLKDTRLCRETWVKLMVQFFVEEASHALVPGC